jgi:hypothetical protein
MNISIGDNFSGFIPPYEISRDDTTLLTRTILSSGSSISHAIIMVLMSGNEGFGIILELHSS